MPAENTMGSLNGTSPALGSLAVSATLVLASQEMRSSRSSTGSSVYVSLFRSFSFSLP